jgi:penicillin-binding protein 1A
MKFSLPDRRQLLRAALAVFLTGFIGLTAVYLYLAPKLPDIEALKDVRLQVPLRIFSRDGLLIAEYGEMKRVPLRYDQFPPQLIQAVLAAEDNRFFEHPGVDYQGLIRAFIHLVQTGERGQGGSTITMQVARNFFLSREKTYSRKINEILLSLKIERELSKEEILELYLNKIYLGKRAYGFAAAAQIYYGKELIDLELPQLAMIAGLPKAPSTYNPIVNPDRAVLRRNYVLRRMKELDFITEGQYQKGLTAEVSASEHTFGTELDAPYLAEMVRAEMLERYGKEAYSYGYNVFTTIGSNLQRAANKAIHNNLINYEHRHGFRGPEKQVELSEDAGSAEWLQALDGMSSVGGLQPAVVVALAETEAVFALSDASLHVLPWNGMVWARRYIDDNTVGDEPTTAADILSKGDVVRVEQNAKGEWQLAQIPEVAGALVSLDPNNGAVQALTGGFDFFSSKFNRVTQAERQPGSNFKPFIYSAALDNGFTPASIINDAPVVFEDSALESEWRPENYSGKFYGPTRLREALVNSRNLVSIRLLNNIGISTAIRYVGKFGFSPERLPRDLSLALGSATLTPYEIVRGYATFANGGFLINPFFIQRIEDSDGKILFEAKPAIACDDDCHKKLERERELATDMAAALQMAGPARESPSPKNDAESIQSLPPAETESETDTAADNPLIETLETNEAAAVVAPLAEDGERFAPLTVDPRNVYLIRSIMQDVIKRGTGRRALQLRRHDLAGKTGTTNDQRDAWFSGYNNDVVTTVWVGFDNPRPLGNRETGAGAALPMWIDYMREALRGKPEHTMSQPEGMVSVRIDAQTGQYTSADNPNAIFELFRVENAPQPGSSMQSIPEGGGGEGSNNGSGGSAITEQLF